MTYSSSPASSPVVATSRRSRRARVVLSDSESSTHPSPVKPHPHPVAFEPPLEDSSGPPDQMPSTEKGAFRSPDMLMPEQNQLAETMRLLTVDDHSGYRAHHVPYPASDMAPCQPAAATPCNLSFRTPSHAEVRRGALPSGPNLWRDPPVNLLHAIDHDGGDGVDMEEDADAAFFTPDGIDSNDEDGGRESEGGYSSTSRDPPPFVADGMGGPSLHDESALLLIESGMDRMSLLPSPSISIDRVSLRPSRGILLNSGARSNEQSPIPIPSISIEPAYHSPRILIEPSYHSPSISADPVYHSPSISALPAYHSPSISTEPTYHSPSNSAEPAYHSPGISSKPAYHSPSLPAVSPSSLVPAAAGHSGRSSASSRRGGLGSGTGGALTFTRSVYRCAGRRKILDDDEWTDEDSSLRGGDGPPSGIRAQKAAKQPTGPKTILDFGVGSGTARTPPAALTPSPAPQIPATSPVASGFRSQDGPVPRLPVPPGSSSPTVISISSDDDDVDRSAEGLPSTAPPTASSSLLPQASGATRDRGVDLDLDPTDRSRRGQVRGALELAFLMNKKLSLKEASTTATEVHQPTHLKDPDLDLGGRSEDVIDLAASSDDDDGEGDASAVPPARPTRGILSFVTPPPPTAITPPAAGKGGSMTTGKPRGVSRPGPPGGVPSRVPTTTSALKIPSIASPEAK